MKALIKADAIQLITTRTAIGWASVLAALTVIGCLVVLIWFPSPFDIETNLRGLHPLMLAFAMISVTANFRHRVFVTEQLICPKVLPALLSKIVVFGACGAFFVLLQMTVTGLFFSVWPGAGFPLSGAGLAMIGMSAFGAAMSGVFGVLIGRLVRVPVAAILLTIAYGLVLEPALQSPLLLRFIEIDAALYEKLTHLLPGVAFHDLLSSKWLKALASTTVLLGWAAILTLFVCVLDRRRESR